MRKCKPNEVPDPIVSTAANCAKGYSYNWVVYIAKEFLEDVRDAQEKGRPFHYSLLIVLIALVGWREPTEAQFVDVPPHMPGAARYASLWVSQDKGLQQMMNYVFAFYSMSISYEILKTPQLSNELFSQYAGVANLKADMHNVFIQAHADDKHACWKLPYVVNKE